MAKSQESLKKEAAKLPSKPGVYKFLGNKNKILYIGKATSLKSRVASYLTKDLIEKRSPIIGKMIEEAKRVEYEETDSVLEALLLESSLIKKFAPPYNTADKDQKSFNYVVITKEKFPRVLMIRERNLKIETRPNDEVGQDSKLEIREAFGPFPHGSELKEALKIVRKIFPFRDRCTPHPDSVSPSPWSGEGRQGQGCFNYQIGLCPGVCVGKVSEKEYRQTIKHIKTFFSGNKKKLIKDLEKEMKDLSQKREFEKASVIKKKIFALKHIQDVALIKKEKVVSSPDFAKATTGKQHSIVRIEAYDIAHISGTDMVGVMTVVEDGEVNKNEYRKFKIRGQKGADDTRALKEVLERRFNHPEWPSPNLIVVDGGVAQLNVAENIIQNLNLQIPIVAVTKDEKHRAREIRIMNNESRQTESFGQVGIMVKKYEREILLANSEAHRFAITFHRKLRRKFV